jgi:protein N-lysine methyltransferase METTL21D
LASLGWDVLATDMPNVISTVLSKNIVRNTASLPVDSGAIQIRELDWTVPPEDWTWENDSVIASATSSEARQAASDLKPSSFQLDPSIQTLAPPFDLILTSDTIYSPELAQPLLRTLCALCGASRRASTCPPIYLCIERRDPDLINRTLAEARSVWGFTVVRIPHRKVAKAMEKGGVKWDQADWEGVEIWKLTLLNVKSSTTGHNRLLL